MTRPRLAACYFGEGKFVRMANVLAHSARKHCPEWSIEVERIHPQLQASPLGVHSHVTNTAKLDWWARVIEQSADGDRVLLIDGDTMVLRDLTPVWDLDFDVAYTTKKPAKFPFNGGVVFVRVCPASRALVKRWHAENARLFARPVEHQKWRAKYGGINQASWGLLLEEGVPQQLGVHVAELPCSEWNCEDTYWRRFSQLKPRIVHVKSRLRYVLFAGSSDYELRPILEAWRAMEAEALAHERRAMESHPKEASPQ